LDTEIKELNAYLPKISIVTVVYNACDFLERTIKSVISQTYPNIEYVIIDGGSTDGSVGIIKKYERNIDKWVSESDKGIYDAMNKGLLSINGDYVQFLNAGDYFVKARSLEKVFSNIQKPYHVVYGDILLVDVTGITRVQKAIEFTKENLLHKGTGVLCHQAMFVRRDVAVFYDIRYCYKGELNWYFDICDKTPNLEYYHVNTPVVYYFLGGVGHKNFLRNRIEWVKVIYDRYGIKTIIQSRILIFLCKNSLYRYKYLKTIKDFFWGFNRSNK
jgi:glycosyltransferase involved in cell wall biosynthesis